MTRKFKMVGVLMAVVAMVALTASAAQGQFTSAAYPATITGYSTKDVWDVFGSTTTCTENSLSGTLAAAGETVTLKPVSKNCSAFGLPATVDFTGCHYLLHKRPWPFPDTIDTNCPTSKSIDIKVYPDGTYVKPPICHVSVPSQTDKSGYTLTNSWGNVIMSGAVGGISATQNRTSIFCPAGTSTTSASYTIQSGGITFSGNNGAISVG